MIAFICLESRGFGTLEMMTYTWRSHSVSFVYNFVSVDLRVCWPFLRLSCSFFFFSFFPESCVVSLRKLHVTQNVLDWCKHNSDFCIVDICHLILEYILKCFVVHHFNSYCSLCFFVGTYYLLFILYFFCTLEMMLENSSDLIFLCKFKMGHKAAKTICNIDNSFGPGTANECTVQWWFKKFYKGDESLEDEQHSNQLLKADNNQLRDITEAGPLTTKPQVAEELRVYHSMVILHLE